MARRDRGRGRRLLLVVMRAVLPAALVALLLAPQPAHALDNGLAGTPPMGWNSYNHFTRDISASLIEAQARAMVASGMKDAGYDYVNIDGGWASLQRGSDGELVPDPDKFPDGIKPVADYVHSLGLKFGLYTSAGYTNCAKTDAGSFRHYRQDAATFASWDVDYLKLDWCNMPYAEFPGMTKEQVDRQLASEMGDALAATGRPIVYSLSAWEGAGHDWLWAGPVANLWRTTQDIKDNWPVVMRNFTGDVTPYQYAGPGGWNDPDALEVGNGGMTATEDRSQFTLWAEMAAPLLAGNDLTAMSAATRETLTNREVIAVDQDPLGSQAEPIARDGGHWVLTRPLAGGDRAVVLFNQGDTPATIRTTAADAGLAAAPDYTLRDLWRHATTETTGAIAATLAPHQAVMYRVAPAPAAPGSYPPHTRVQTSPDTAWLVAGHSTTVTVTLANDGRSAVTNVSLSLAAPQGWSAAATSPTAFDDVASGESASATFRVTAPADAQPGSQATLTGRADYVWRGTHASEASDATLSIAYPSLASAFDNVGISDDSDVYPGDLDGLGNSYSQQTLDAAGLSPGAAFSHGSVALTWPDVPAGQADNVIARGETIAFSGQGAHLTLVGSGSPADEGGSGTVHYSDGTSSTYTADLDNYFNPPGAGTGNDTVAKLPYINTTNAAKNGGVIGRRNHVGYLFAVDVPIDPAKTVTAVTLPDSGGAPGPDGRLAGMHVFSLGVG